jgi:hypothetical protein
LSKGRPEAVDFFMQKTENENRETRYFVDIDLATKRLVKLDYAQRTELVHQEPEKPTFHRVFLTKGQYKKLEKKLAQFLPRGR